MGRIGVYFKDAVASKNKLSTIKMKKLKLILLIAFLLKILSVTIKTGFSWHNNEYAEFYENESFRKYREHEYDYTLLKVATEEDKNIPREVANKLENGIDLHKRSEIINRTWFQDYFRFLPLKMSTTSPDNIIRPNDYPTILANTVLEENAKNEIYSVYKMMNWLTVEHDPHQVVKGLIRDIRESQDSLTLEIMPFSYSTNELFDDCMKGTQYFRVASNPFFYQGSLKNWYCTKCNIVTDEIYKIKFD